MILNELIKFSITNKEFTKFQIGLKYIKEIETFIDIIQKNKEDIYNKYIKNNYNNKNIDTAKIFEKGITEKENHSGIGLWEVNQILKRNNNAKLITNNGDKYFEQTLEIYY